MFNRKSLPALQRHLPFHNTCSENISCKETRFKVCRCLSRNKLHVSVPLLFFFKEFERKMKQRTGASETHLVTFFFGKSGSCDICGRVGTISTDVYLRCTGGKDFVLQSERVLSPLQSSGFLAACGCKIIIKNNKIIIIEWLTENEQEGQSLFTLFRISLQTGANRSAAKTHRKKEALGLATSVCTSL